MGEVKGFLKYQRALPEDQTVLERLKHWNEFHLPMPEEALSQQGARCMDCGVPFCHWGCPIGNIIPDFNELVYRGKWKEALERLWKTNNFPEFTGRVCPAPCENSCVLGINNPAVTIKNIEYAIIEKAYAEGWVMPRPPKKRTGRKVAVIGSGPSGLACADELNQKGHTVTVYEKNDMLGGLLTLGIPTFKLDKLIVERRLNRMDQEGVKFKTKAHVGVNISAEELRNKYDAVVLCGGAENPRDLNVSGRELKGIYLAMEYLTQQTRVNLGKKVSLKDRIDAKGKDVIVLGGGDTGSDCVGTANRQGAKSVRQLELLPQPPLERAFDNPWPQWATIYRKSTSHEEGVIQDFSVLTKSFSGEKGHVKHLHGVRLDFGEKNPQTGQRSFKEIVGSEFTLNCDLVLLAMGFLGPAKQGLLEELKIALDARGNVQTDDNKMTNILGVFAAGDMRRGQSLVVWAIQEGRSVAESVNDYLIKS